MTQPCPRIAEITGGAKDHPFNIPESKWGEKNTCSHCGSLHPDDVFELIEDGAEITPTDKNYKIYISSANQSPTGKFYFQHFDEAQCRRFIDLLNEKKLKLAAPGYFYNRPFFMAPAKS